MKTYVWICALGLLVVFAGFESYIVYINKLYWQEIPAKVTSSPVKTSKKPEIVQPLTMDDLKKCVRINYYKAYTPKVHEESKTLPDHPPWFYDMEQTKVGEYTWTYALELYKGNLYVDNSSWASRIKHAATHNEYLVDSANFSIHLFKQENGYFIDCDEPTPFVVENDPAEFNTLGSMVPIIGMFHGKTAYKIKDNYFIVTKPGNGMVIGSGTVTSVSKIK